MSAMNLQPDLRQAERFLTLLDETAESFTFQTFTDTPSGTAKPDPDPLAKIKHGTLSQHASWLTSMNCKGAGIFVAVNATDGRGRGRDNITRIRALWQEDDTGDTPALPTDPHIVVESSPGRFHRYLLVDDLPMVEFEPAQHRMVLDYGSDPRAQDRARVLRLPGFWHVKDKANPHLVTITQESGTRPIPWAKLRTILPPAERQAHTPKDSEARVHVTPGQVADLRSALNSISADDYQTWIAMGHALVELGNTGRGLWLDWSQTSAKWQPQDAGKWATFTGERTAYQAVFAEAQRRGWVNPKARDAELPPLLPRPDTQGERRAWLTHVGELLHPPPPLEWLIRDMLLPETLTMLVADPSAGKSLLALAWGASIAIGRPWLGRKVRQGPVVYVCGEGHHGVRRRLKAWAIAHDCEEELSQAPLFVSSSGTRLVDPRELNVVMEDVDGVAEEHGPPRLIILDTLHRTSGMDENSSEDAALLFAHLDQLRTRYECTVLVVHHSGHGSKDRGRGSSAFRGGMDTEYLLQVAGDVRTLKIAKGKDMEDPAPIGFVLKQITLPWRDADGRNETSVVLEAMESAPPVASGRASPSIRLGIETLLTAMDADGTDEIPLETWREVFYSRHTGDSLEAKRKSFQRIRTELTSNHVVKVKDDCYRISELAGSCRWSDVAGMVHAHRIKIKPC